MGKFEYKILQFEPECMPRRVEDAFNELGTEGWELVSVTPVGLRVKGESGMMGGTGSGRTEGSFTWLAAYFKRAL